MTQYKILNNSGNIITLSLPWQIKCDIKYDYNIVYQFKLKNYKVRLNYKYEASSSCKIIIF